MLVQEFCSIWVWLQPQQIKSLIFATSTIIDWKAKVVLLINVNGGYTWSIFYPLLHVCLYWYFHCFYSPHDTKWYKNQQIMILFIWQANNFITVLVVLVKQIKDVNKTLLILQVVPFEAGVHIWSDLNPDRSFLVQKKDQPPPILPPARVLWESDTGCLLV